jgi:bifunctional DNA-binding transcriptional regulator/antitoxin component of YhaV-PrlF toxin-antitoxin module
MTSTLTMDAAGRVVLPKKIRDKLELEVEPPETKIVVNAAGRRVVVGWGGFNAVEAIKADRAARDAKLIGIRRKSGK